jgi:DNA invertase Pin-like site-specific DNA recombinase
MIMNVLAAVTQFERGLLIERTQSRQRAWVEGKQSGRRAAPTEDHRAAAEEALEAGETASELARRYETRSQTMPRAKAAA